jgi:hypothetical protein
MLTLDHNIQVLFQIKYNYLNCISLMIEKNNLTKTETSIGINKNLFQRLITLKKKIENLKKKILCTYFFKNLLNIH